MINVAIEKNSNENNTSIIRRFTKRVQGSGILPRIRSIRYAKRKSSSYTRKKHALKGLRRREEVDKLIKLGKMVDKTRK